MPTPSCHKRKRSSSSSSSISLTSMNDFPELPKITGEVILETFTHRSLRVEANNDQSNDNERLSQLGNKVLLLAVTNLVFHRKPIVNAADIPTECSKVLSEENYKIWVERYRLRNKLRFSPSDAIDLNTPEENRTLFEAYVGAVFTQSGMDVITRWITRLVDPKITLPSHDDGRSEQQSAKRARIKRETRSPEYSPFEPVSTTPQTYPPDSVYIGMPAANTFAIPTTSRPGPSSNLNVTYLQTFNQRCAQQHLQVEYQADNLGLQHAPRWVLKCFVNGIEKGQGQGASKQIAKEEAAKMAFYGMGWADYGRLPGSPYTGPGFTG